MCAPFEVSAYSMTNDNSSDTKFISFSSFFRFDFTLFLARSRVLSLPLVYVVVYMHDVSTEPLLLLLLLWVCLVNITYTLCLSLRVPACGSESARDEKERVSLLFFNVHTHLLHRVVYRGNYELHGCMFICIMFACGYGSNVYPYGWLVMLCMDKRNTHNHLNIHIRLLIDGYSFTLGPITTLLHSKSFALCFFFHFEEKFP